ncbi:hypothetical protein AVEN_136555-1 [Araneus ventricosus]|uniref:Uncharacterized protein n=1 Tax=Araneus ventricosus TaxID=182803 RepID=A0A4Y2EGZ8_ARAVE|nr:hypothetical protein AVEN_264188-1 [Araneus ventricosus]GBM27498.1 hypothetical protein AVEN_117113-1 [Araneus ventricosus]GBM27513.1 hypothetical protein AVEN_123431-1 [Araneus ventricosus]GBM27519.1 hypothetical protein AVEN_136555-1 [Araneus ventricosus]
MCYFKYCCDRGDLKIRSWYRDRKIPALKCDSTKDLPYLWPSCMLIFEDECQAGVAQSLPIVTNTCRLLWLLATDCHVGVTSALVQLGLTRKSARRNNTFSVLPFSNG